MDHRLYLLLGIVFTMLISMDGAFALQDSLVEPPTNTQSSTSDDAEAADMPVVEEEVMDDDIVEDDMDITCGYPDADEFDFQVSVDISFHFDLV